jgi:uncharacterized membrane protein YhaH (DUF805 family)
MQRFLTFYGRATRAEWWAFNLLGWVPFLLLMAVLPEDYEPSRTASVAFFAVVFCVNWLGIMCTVRRLRDRDRHGAWIFLGLLPIAGGIWLLIECGILPGTDGPNKYGMRQPFRR